jgi:hypothetical protein
MRRLAWELDADPNILFLIPFIKSRRNIPAVAENYCMPSKIFRQETQELLLALPFNYNLLGYTTKIYLKKLEDAKYAACRPLSRCVNRISRRRCFRYHIGIQSSRYFYSYQRYGGRRSFSAKVRKLDRRHVNGFMPGRKPD